MKIAQIAPLYESVPPKLYGGTERVVSYLTEELVRLGHEVTLFASGDSRTSARLESGCSKALRLTRSCSDPLAYHTILLDKVLARADEFDILHFHTDYSHFPATRGLQLPTVTTLHGRLDLADLKPLYRRFSQQPLVSISQSQRPPLGRVNWVGNVYHGIPPNLYQLQPEHGNYLAFLGRISPEKRPDRAIRIALKAGMPLKIAAKVDDGRPRILSVRNRAAIEEPGHRIPGRNQRRAEEQVFGQRICVPVPYRLARTLRANDDRSDGLRNADDRVLLRFRAGTNYGWCDRFYCEERRGSGGSVETSARAEPGAMPRDVRAAIYGFPDGKRLFVDLRSACGAFALAHTVNALELSTTVLS